MAEVVPIVGRPCGEWIDGVGSCPDPVLFDCPICNHRRCLAHSMAVKPPSKRRCCMREITEGEVQAWRRGEAAYARALIVQQHVERQRRTIGFILRDAREITEDDVEHAIKAGSSWMTACEFYLSLSKIDRDNSAVHMKSISHCARNAVLCAEWAKEWATARSSDVGTVRAKGGLRLLAPSDPPSEKPLPEAP